jgi:putative endonuclease
MGERVYYVYILASRSRNLYTGMTNCLERRVYEHKRHLIPGFTARYRIERLVYCEAFRDVRAAIAREKQIKSWTRGKRVALIESMNPTWSDLAEEWEKRWKRVEAAVRNAAKAGRGSADPSLRSG